LTPLADQGFLPSSLPGPEEGGYSKVPYWILEWTEHKKTGAMKPDLFGPFGSESRADEYLEMANMSEAAQVYNLSTQNSARATQMLKAKNVISRGSVSEGMQRFRHPQGHRKSSGGGDGNGKEENYKSELMGAAKRAVRSQRRSPVKRNSDAKKFLKEANFALEDSY